jgi:CRP/FNR family transcriptional regulator, cyclic AMP receptor protein
MSATRKSARRPKAEPKKTPVFDPALFLGTTGGGRTVLKLQKNQPVFLQGDPADAVFYLRKGKIKIAVTSAQGKEAVIAIVGAGEFLGEGCLNGQPLRLASARAMSESFLMRVPRDTMLRTLSKEPALAALFTTHLLARNSRIEEDLVDHLFNSSEKRLARSLLLLANFGKEKSPEPIVFNISQETLAEMIGTTRSRVSFFMNKFRSLGFLDYDSAGIAIHPSLLSIVLRD